ncbi:MAG: hypothetical protein ACTHLE_27115 [Agriterribacter sp.]
MDRGMLPSDFESEYGYRLVYLFITGGVNYLNIKYPMDWLFTGYSNTSDLLEQKNDV